MGTVVGMEDGWIQVDWDNGFNWIYRMGAEHCYDLQLAGNNVHTLIMRNRLLCSSIHMNDTYHKIT